MIVSWYFQQIDNVLKLTLYNNIFSGQSHKWTNNFVISSKFAFSILS